MKFKSKDVDEYLNTLNKSSNIELNELVNFNEIIQNVKNIESDLLTLNKLLKINNYDEFINELKLIFSQNHNLSQTLKFLVATKNLDFELNTIDNLILFFNETGLTKLILDKSITNFVDYFIGVYVGLSVNKRKNIIGKKQENSISNMIHNFFKDYDYIKIHQQIKIKKLNNLSINDEELNNKVFDFIVEDKLNNKYLLIESSFYNIQGSKISETSRAYYEVFTKVQKYKNKLIFIWVADGKGMKSIIKDLKIKWKEGYVTNKALLVDKLKEIF